MRSNSKPLLMLAAAVLAGAVLATCKAPSAGGGAGLNELPFVDGGQIPDDPDAGVILNTGPKERCNISLDRFKVSAGTGAKASKIAAASELIGGPTAAGKIGDYLLVNDKIKVVIQGVDRHIGPQPYGATILDADLVRPAGAPGRDQFGETGLLYNFGRTVEPTFFEVLSDGSAGGSAILAMSGRDTANDYLGIRNQLKSKLGTVPAGDPYAELPLRITNYFILNPGEQKVKFLTALCNEGEKEVALAVGDLTDPGYTLEFFNPRSCTNGFGYGGTCFGLDDLDWYGYQGDGVAYGYAPYKPGQPTVPETSSAMMTIAGITGTIHGSPGFLGLLQWFDPKLTTRTGELRIPPGDARIVARDFVVGRDLGDVASVIASDRNALTGASTGEVSGIVTSLGKPVPQARVTLCSSSSFGAVAGTMWSMKSTKRSGFTTLSTPNSSFASLKNTSV